MTKRLPYFKPEHTHTAADQAELLFVFVLTCTVHVIASPLVSTPFPLLIVFICVYFVCSGGQFNERPLLWQPFERYAIGILLIVIAQKI